LSAYEHAAEVVRRAAARDQWGGLGTLAAISEAVYLDHQPSYRMPAPAACPPPKCSTCQDLGYIHPEGERYMLCSCGAMREVAISMVRVGNDNLALERARGGKPKRRSYGAVMKALEDLGV
jgi:hypothetical protein